MEQIKKVALVTGASMPRGNGSAIALALANQGIDVAVTAFTRLEGAQKTADEIAKLGRKSIAVRMDGRDYQSVKEAVGKVREALGPISILVNNAAQMGHNITIAKTTIDEWDNEVKTCLNSAFYCIKETWADMCGQKWGRIINITSVAGILGGYGQSSYGSAKAGLIAMSKSAALEGARFNITANCILIGIVSTESFTDLLPQEVQERVAKKTVWAKAAEPVDIARAAAYLVSDDARYMTGATMNMLGGMDLFVF